MTDSLDSNLAKLKILFIVYFLTLVATIGLIFYLAKKDMAVVSVRDELANLSISSTASTGESLIKDTLLSGEKLSKQKNYDISLNCRPVAVNLINCDSESTVSDRDYTFSFEYKTTKYPYVLLNISADSSNSNYAFGSVKLADGRIKTLDRIDSDFEIAQILAEFREKLESKM